MAGTGLEIAIEGDVAIHGLERSVRQLARDLSDPRALLEALGAEIESQTRERISSEKRSPSGRQWPEWGASYARTRHSGQSLLQGDGGLLDSLMSVVDRARLETGSPLAYSALHQFGGEPVDIPVPAREWLGLSAANARDAQAVVDEFAMGLIEAVVQ